MARLVVLVVQPSELTPQMLPLLTTVLYAVAVEQGAMAVLVALVVLVVLVDLDIIMMDQTIRQKTVVGVQVII